VTFGLSAASLEVIAEFGQDQLEYVTARTGSGDAARDLAEPAKGHEPKYCSRCATMMVLVRVAPQFGPLAELRTYKCLQCGCVVEEDIER
jgi:hypothetical protein